MIHEKIRHLRELRRLRDEDMADRLGISQSTYSRLEKGEIKLDVERLRKIAEVLEVPVEDLLNTEPVVFHVHDNKGGSHAYGLYSPHSELHELPKEFLHRLADLHEAHLKELQEMNKRLLALLEQKQG